MFNPKMFVSLAEQSIAATESAAGATLQFYPEQVRSTVESFQKAWFSIARDTVAVGDAVVDKALNLGK